MKIHDITLPLSDEIPVWPGDPRFVLDFPRHLGRGDSCTVGHISLSLHCGTHVDAPAHFLRNGNTVESLDPGVLIGPALVVDVGNVSVIDAAVLRGLDIPAGSERILFRTRNSDLWSRGEKEFCEEFVAISADGAAYLVERGVRLAGIDYLSIAPFADGAKTHEIFLSAGVILLEGLTLATVLAGRYTLVCLPLAIKGGEGAPARAVLIEE